MDKQYNPMERFAIFAKMTKQEIGYYNIINELTIWNYYPNFETDDKGENENEQ